MSRLASRVCSAAPGPPGRHHVHAMARFSGDVRPCGSITHHETSLPYSDFELDSELLVFCLAFSGFGYVPMQY